MTAETPEWLLVMRAMNGLTETPGSGDNPKILAMRDQIAKTYPDMASYCALYQHDATPWCGLAVAYAMTMGGVRPVFGPTDTDRWMWARAWDDDVWGYPLSVPRPGAVVVMEREGGGHVTLYERTEGSNYVCRGGNQSDAVNQASYPISKVVALMWPKAEGPPPPAPRRELKKGDSGPDVEMLQAALGIPPDGEFGNVTDAGVRGYQAACGLVVDGEVGPATWEKVDALVLRMETGSDGLSEALKHDITELAITHPIQEKVWKDRGRSPSGYIAGMGQCFALALSWLAAHDPAAIEMAQAEGDADEDALAWLAPEFAKLGISNAVPGVDTLRSLFMLMIGLGMRESSGKYYEGRDVSATNTTADTAEAGLFQASWNIKTASPILPKLMEDFVADPNGFLSIFSEGLTPTSSGLTNFGSGQGAVYQWLAKYSPAFATMVAAIGLRTRRKHWGPINRREVELVAEAADYLAKVEELMAEGPAPEPEPEPEPKPEPEIATVNIVTAGPVIVTVNGNLVSSNG
jgi:uncharacterized protein (TIGR02594 family)